MSSSKALEQHIIQSYQQDEQMMILVFAQWCINHDADPKMLYSRAYPDQPANLRLEQALALTVSKEEAGLIPDEALLGVLALYGNEDLAFVVTEEIGKRQAPRSQ